MPALSDYVAGTITLTNGSTDFTGAGTGWLAADFREGDTIFQVAGQTQWDAVIASITSNTAGTLALPWGGATGTYAYRMRYMADGARVTAQARNLIELLGNGNALAFAGLTGPGVVVFNGPHSMIVKPESDFVNGVFFNASVPNFAGRAAYNGQPGPTGNTPGFTVLVISDVNFDNKTTLYSKLSDTSGDWSTAAIITGDIGEMPTLDVGSTTTLPPGSTATVDVNPVVGGYELDFGIPEGRGAKYVPGGYNPATTYTLDEVVTQNGSSWILIVASSVGNAPPILPTTSNTWWELLARAGNDGAGTVTTLTAGAGIAIDLTDPTDPIISATFIIRNQVFTASGTYTPHANMVQCRIECVGGGAAGGTCAVSASGQQYASGGGGAGARSIGFHTKADIGASKTVTIGAGGSSVGSTTGNAGGDTSVGTLVVAKGGSGGTQSGFSGPGGPGGDPSTGTGNLIKAPGWRGHRGIGNAIIATIEPVGGNGANSPYGQGGEGRGAGTSGSAGSGYGSGGGGSAAQNGGGSGLGGAGAAGIVIITEYCSA